MGGFCILRTLLPVNELTNSSVGILMGIKPASEGGNRSPRKVRIPTLLLVKLASIISYLKKLSRFWVMYTDILHFSVNLRAYENNAQINKRRKISMDKANLRSRNIH